MRLKPQTDFGRYRITSFLGAGGMGEVYLANDTVLRRPVAIKLIPADSAGSNEQLHRFRREVYAASSLNHPNILTIYEIGAVPESYFIVTEFIDGASLRELIPGAAQLRLDLVLQIALQVASALSAAHMAGIIHRDIKPENIMVRGDQIVKVLDFGLAKPLELEATAKNPDANTRDNSTRPGALLGTVAYMSPEQLRGQPIDARTDIWSFGVVLYELLTGHQPFEGASDSDLIASILRIDFRPPQEFLPGLPEGIVNVVNKCLAKDKDERYQSIEAVMEGLKLERERLESTLPLQRKSFNPSDATTGPTTRRLPIRRRAIVASTLAFALALLGIAILRQVSDTQINSIAVLPFASNGSIPELEYLSDGLSEGVINKLAQIPQLKVIARSSTARYKSAQVDPKRVAQDMGVEAILVGNITRIQNEILISAELVSGKDSARIWGGQFRRAANGLVAVQSEIAEEIARQLHVNLSASESRRLTKPETVNPLAFEMLLKGRHTWRKGGSENWKKAIDYYQQAIVLDPNYALAYANLAGSYKSLIGNSLLDPGEFRQAAEAAVKRALELDDSLADAHYTLANLKTDAWDWQGAEEEYQRSLELNPNLAAAHNAYSSFLSVKGRHDESLAVIQRAREIDPFSLMIHANAGYRLYFARRYDEAIQTLQKTLEKESKYALAHILLGYVYSAKRMYPEAIASYKDAIANGGDTPGTHIYLAAAYAGSGQVQKAEEITRRFESKKEYVAPAELSVLHAALGRKEQAFKLLEQAYSARDLQLQYVAVDPAYDTLRADPRFQDLLRRIGLD
jgi:serine/threonine-protein kinase